MFSALIFSAFNCWSYLFAFTRGPFWGLFAYMNIYFNTPNERINWWASVLPFDRWSLLTSLVLVLTLFMNKDQLSTHKMSSAKWMFAFFGLSFAIALTTALNKSDAFQYLYLLFTFCLIVFILVRTLKTKEQLRSFLFYIVVFVGYLSFDAYLNGQRINNRLEGSGSADANQSNEFALLLAAVIPMLIAFLIKGTRNEKIACFISLPFVINAFILCNSRGGAVAFIASTLYAVFLVADNKMRRNMIVLMVAALPVIIFLADEAYIERFSSLMGIGSAMEDEAQARELSSGRTEIWGYGLNMAKDNPFGAGPNSFKKIARFYMPEDVLTFHPGATYGVRSAHNTYLQIIVEQGVIGLGIWLLMCLQTCYILYKSFKILAPLGKEYQFWKTMAFSLNISFFTILLGGLMNSRIYYEFFWWQLAIAVIIYSLSKEMAADKEEKEGRPLTKKEPAYK